MEKKKRTRLLVLILALVLLCATAIPVIAIATAGEGEEEGASASVTTAPYTVEYEKPSIGEIVGDGAYPAEKDSSESSATAEKEWYEYITYSKEPIGYYEVPSISPLIPSRVRYVYYDPYDYSYGLVMEVEDALGQFSTKNEFKISTKTFASLVIESAVETEIKNELTAGVEATYMGITAKVEDKITTRLGWTVTTTATFSREETIEETFQAAHFNADGVPYQWRVVHYAVYLPLKVERERYVNGEWIPDGTVKYVQLATIEGLCREYIKNEVTYMEHWGTGEGVPVEDFWNQYFTKDRLADAYKNNLLPWMIG